MPAYHLTVAQCGIISFPQKYHFLASHHGGEPVFIWNSGALDVILEQKMMSLGKTVQHRNSSHDGWVCISLRCVYRFVGSVHPSI